MSGNTASARLGLLSDSDKGGAIFFIFLFTEAISSTLRTFCSLYWGPCYLDVNNAKERAFINFPLL